ncbi:MAG: hypothetical protein HYY14_02595 [Candidatus Omnitrophica bacterium]|nr:hypothetical protein [Candidatus Omnitrophota bacterium]
MPAKKETLEIAATIAAVLALVVLVAVRMGGSGKRQVPPSPVVVEETASGLTQSAPRQVVKKAPAVSIPEGWGRDPFLSVKEHGAPREAPAGPLNLELFGIVSDPERPGESYAIINDEVVRVNESIEGARVVEIKRGSVAVQRGGQVFTLTLPVEPDE